MRIGLGWELIFLSPHLYPFILCGVGSAPPALGGPFPFLSLMGSLVPAGDYVQALQGAVEGMWALWSP